MTKFYGLVGFVETVLTDEGVWEPVTVERIYRGDIYKNTKRFDGSDKVNDNLTLNNTVSIVADAYAYNHFSSIRFVRFDCLGYTAEESDISSEFKSPAWKVTMVEVNRPRLILTVGGVYNAER